MKSHPRPSPALSTGGGREEVKARPPAWVGRAGGRGKDAWWGHILLNTTLKILYILWMKLLNIWCKVVQALSLSPFGKEHLVVVLSPTPLAQAVPSSLAQGWGLGLGGWHVLFFLLWPPAGEARLQVGPTARGSG